MSHRHHISLLVNSANNAALASLVKIYMNWIEHTHRMVLRFVPLGDIWFISVFWVRPQIDRRAALQLKQEQDAAYQASLMADRAKVSLEWVDGCSKGIPSSGLWISGLWISGLWISGMWISGLIVDHWIVLWISGLGISGMWISGLVDFVAGGNDSNKHGKIRRV